MWLAGQGVRKACVHVKILDVWFLLKRGFLRGSSKELSTSTLYREELQGGAKLSIVFLSGWSAVCQPCMKGLFSKCIRQLFSKFIRELLHCWLCWVWYTSLFAPCFLNYKILGQPVRS